jgi:hypothetical protein
MHLEGVETLELQLGRLHFPAPKRPGIILQNEKDQNEKWHQLNESEVIILYTGSHEIGKNDFKQNN